MTPIRHLNPSRPERTARAPYNFIPLPAAVFLPGEPLPPYDTLDPERHTGWLDLAITTETPLYVRAAVPEDDRGGNEPPDFFHHGDPARPVIPGSSLRGMLRSLVEILAHARLTNTKSRQLYFRSLAPNALTDEYQRRRTENIDGEVRAGLLRRRTDGGHEIEPRILARIAYDKIESLGLGTAHVGRGPNAAPRLRLQYRRVIARAQRVLPRTGRPFLDITNVRLANAGEQPETGEQAGILVITGTAQTKKREFVFLEDTGAPVEVPAAMIADFDADDQLTRWQREAYPRWESGQPLPDGRLLREESRGQQPSAPVFYLLKSDGTLDSFGRAAAYRLPYAYRTAAYLPGDDSGDGLDLVEALFGNVTQGTAAGDRPQAIKSRLFVEDAHWDGSGPAPFLDGPQNGLRTPRVLAGPKPSAFQHYLVQTRPDDNRTLAHFDTPPEQTALRGTKRYWHKPGLPAEAMFEPALKNPNDRLDTQHTLIRPVRPGVTFRGRLRFENLSALELGALLAALRLPEGARHQLGMGKPLGMGSVHINTALTLIDPARRYRTLFNDAGQLESGARNSEATDETADTAVRAFTRAIVAHHNACDEPKVEEDAPFWDIPRLQALALMLRWDGAPAPDATRTIGLTEPSPGYRGPARRTWWNERPVLPTPHGVLGLPDPWAPEPEPVPEPAAAATGRRGEGRPHPEERGEEPVAAPMASALERLLRVSAGDVAPEPEEPAAPANPNLWEGATLKYQNRILVAEFQRRTARSAFGTTADLLDALPPEARSALQRGRTLSARVEIAPGPRGNDIVAVAPLD